MLFVCWWYIPWVVVGVVHVNELSWVLFGCAIQDCCRNVCCFVISLHKQIYNLFSWYIPQSKLQFCLKFILGWKWLRAFNIVLPLLYYDIIMTTFYDSWLFLVYCHRNHWEVEPSLFHSLDNGNVMIVVKMLRAESTERVILWLFCHQILVSLWFYMNIILTSEKKD